MKIILVTLIFAINVMAESFTFMVDNSTMVDVYFNIFNVIASLFQNNTYLTMLKLSFLVGGFISFFSGIIGKGGTASLSEFGKHLLIGTTLLTLMFSHKSDVEIKTNQLGSYCSVANASVTTGTVVGNIPTLFAWFSTVTNTFGTETTRLSRLAFSPLTSNTSNLSRSDFAESIAGIGTVMSLNLDTIAAQNSSQDAQTIGDAYVGITNDCILIPAGQDPVFGSKIISTYKSTGNTIETLNDLIFNGALMLYKNPTDNTGVLIDPIVTMNGIAPKNLLVTINGTTTTCEEAWTTLSNRIAGLKNNHDIACMSNFKDILSPTTMSVLTGTPKTESQMDTIIINTALANQVSDSKKNLITGTAISEMSYATGKSIAEVSLKSKANGDYLAEMLPYLQMGMRAVIYAFFPFLFIILLLPGGMKVLSEYLKSVIWIELWTPAAAVLDMFLNLSATEKFSNLYNNTGMNSLSLTSVFSDATMISGVAGYLYASIPAITWMIMSSTGQSMESIGSGLMGGITGQYGSIVEKNLSSEQQNEDRALRQQSSITGETIAKVQAMSMEHNALKSAGNWLTNEENKGSLVKAGQGEALSKIMSGSATQDVYGGNKEAQQSFNINEKQKQLDVLMKQVATGTDGGDKTAMLAQATTLSQKFNQDLQDEKAKQKAIGTDTNSPEKVSAVAGIRATESAKAVLLAGAEQKALGIDKASDPTGKNMDAYVQVKTNETMTQYETERKTQEIFGGGEKSINIRSEYGAESTLKSISEFNSEVSQQMKQNPKMSREEAIVKAAHNIGTMNGLKEQEIQTRLQAFAGEKGRMKNGVLTFSDKGNKNLIDTVNRNANVAAQTDVGTGNTNATDAEIRSAAKINKDTNVAEQLAIPKLNENTMKAAVAMGDKEAIALEKKIAGYGSARKNMARAAFIKSTLGIFGDVSSKVMKSAGASENLSLGSNATTLGELDSQKLTGKINSEKDALRALFASAFTIDPKTKRQVLNKNSNSYKAIRKAMSKAGLGGSGVMSLSNTNAAAIGMTSMNMLQNKSTALNLSIDNLTANKLQHNKTTSEVLATSEVTTRESEQVKNATIISVLRTEDGSLTQADANKLYGEIQGGQELLRAAQLGIDILANGLSSLTFNRNTKVTEANKKLAIEKTIISEKQAIQKANNERIREIQNTLKTEEGSNKALKTEMYRLISENKTIKSDLLISKQTVSELSKEIKTYSKTSVDKFKETFREKSIEEKFSKMSDAEKLKELEKPSLKPASSAATAGSKAASVGLKGLGVAGLGYTVYEGAKEGNQRVQAGDNTGAAIVGGKTAAIIGAGLVGGEAGGTVGATIGTFILPGVGTAVGGVVGGVIGGGIGAIGASMAGDSVLEMYDNRKIK